MSQPPEDLGQSPSQGRLPSWPSGDQPPSWPSAGSGQDQPPSWPSGSQPPSWPSGGSDGGGRRTADRAKGSRRPGPQPGSRSRQRGRPAGQARARLRPGRLVVSRRILILVTATVMVRGRRGSERDVRSAALSSGSVFLSSWASWSEASPPATAPSRSRRSPQPAAPWPPDAMPRREGSVRSSTSWTAAVIPTG